MKRLLIGFLFMICIQLVGQDKSFLIISRNTGYYYMHNGDSLRVFTFASKLSAPATLPGPTLEFEEGDSVEIDLWNVTQGAPHTIHLHGLDVNQANDGVPHLSFSVSHTEHGYYRFKAPHPGTYIYHCHVASSIHVQAGMYGLIIIRPKGNPNLSWNGGYEFKDEHSILTSEIDPLWHNDFYLYHEHDTSADAVQRHEVPDKYEPRYFLANGLSEKQLKKENQLGYTFESNGLLRLCNIGFYGNKYVFPKSLNAKIISSDGRPLHNQYFSDTLEILPGERYQVWFENMALANDSIAIQFYNLNTQNIESTQFVRYNVEKKIGINRSINEGIVDLYPNPSEQKFTINSNSNIKLVTIKSTTGQTILTKVPSNDKKELLVDASNLVSGTYFVFVSTIKKEEIIKFVKN